MKRILIVIIFINLFIFNLNADESIKKIEFSPAEINYLRDVKDLKILVNSDNTSKKGFVAKLETPLISKDKNNSFFNIYTFLILILLISTSYFFYKYYSLIKKNNSLDISLQECEKIFHSTINAIVVSKNFYVTNANDVALKMLGYKDKRELIGMHIFYLVSSSAKDVVKQNIVKMGENAYESEGLRKDGSVFPVLIKGTSYKINNETHRISSILDLSDIKNKEKVIFEKNKMVALGEMLGNISHQWRQPLSVISTAASGVMLQKKINVLKDDFFYEAMNTIVNNTKHLSKTIDVFTNFIKEDKEKTFFSINNNISNTLDILSSMLLMNEIEVVLEFSEKFYLKNYENEFSEAIINILNNAKDAFSGKNIENKLIFINVYKEDYKTIIEIKDNAGGIKPSLLNNIFEPYFTTKHKSQGTGLGLYIVDKIIVKSMKGTICANNTSYTYNNTTYKGALFRLCL